MKTQLRQQFGQNIKALRLASGISQESFADKCGFARSYMSRIERGVANPSIDAIQVLADALGVDAGTFFNTPAVASKASTAANVSVPFAADGTCFNPALKRTRTGKYTVGARGNELSFDDFEDAVAHLRTMEPAYWRRPNAVGNWGRVVAVRWGVLPKKY